ncbi:aminotransferase class I/II-fold pyridoxal phosphate-dependent enzyme [Lignipirellula cremea]|uniref:Pyridoxal phosphate-dependent acyltransferase n=1 Tax=Lignipirellula cremea TaxID=2528010 RepID=A0A518DY27_9BACT|nr:aminotransferase class I/II-fold pyridoxal phosphate-dependent enzyme [Lignipirellula cremea]QDU96701.1 Putative pyridoxal phosphate-dependent acyltransferase [Lignipirellula cremea]
MATSNTQDVFESVANSVFEHVKKKAPPDVELDLSLDTSLYDVGLDSLARMDVANSLEQTFGMRFSEESLYDIETCRDLVECIVENMADSDPLKAAAAEKKAPVAEPRKASVSTAEIPEETHDVRLFPECVGMEQQLAAAAAFGVTNPFFRVNERLHGARSQVNSRDLINFTSFDYLGLARDPRVIAAAKAGMDQFGTSASASRLVGGENTLLQDLDRELAKFLGTEAALILPSGYGTNASLFGHLFGADDLIVYDELSHNSIVTGSQLSKAKRRSFPHNDHAFLDKLLADIRGDFRRVVVALEGTYSMDGDYPSLPDFVEIKNRHKALLYIDEAHSVGVMGPTGRGICEKFGVDPNEGDLWMGTISKALASGGGYIAGRKTLIQYLKYTMPAFVFATAASPANSAATLTALRIIEQEPERVTRLRERSTQFLELAKGLGLNVGESEGTPIVPIIIGNSMRCMEISQQLMERGVNAQPILYPAVPEKASRVRFFINADHTPEEIQHTIDALQASLEATAET